MIRVIRSLVIVGTSTCGLLLASVLGAPFAWGQPAAECPERSRRVPSSSEPVATLTAPTTDQDLDLGKNSADPADIDIPFGLSEGEVPEEPAPAFAPTPFRQGRTRIPA